MTQQPTNPLKLPDGISQVFYDRVRADATLGSALDREMIPVLQASGPPADRIVAFVAARERALAHWDGKLTPEEGASQATGPMENPGRVAFDRVSTDVLRAYLIATAERIAAGTSPNHDKLATLRDLEERARKAFVWDPASGDSVAVRLMLIRASIEQKATP